jgi:sulfate permease, SulP family
VNRAVNRTGGHRLIGNLYGGLTAAVVALPLALAFGVASGAGPAAGLYGAIFTGLFASLFGGTASQISGPTGPMTVVMALILTRFAGNPAEAFTVVMMAGLIQIGLGRLGIGQYVTYIPYKVIAGFMTGIGLLIVLMQLGPLVGHAPGGQTTTQALAAVPGQWREPNLAALAVAAIASLVVWGWPRSWGRILPAPLAALIAATLAVAVWLADAPVLGPMPSVLPAPVLPSINWADLDLMLQAAFTLALLGSIDSLLTSLVADNLTGTHHDSRRELVGQGIGNLAAGLFGGIPGAGATMRTVVNIRAGGNGRLSGVVHAVVLAGVLLGLGPLVAHVPHAALAAILFKVGFDIIDWPYLRRLPRCPREIAIVVVTVAAFTVFVDLVTAVMVGLVMHSLISARSMTAAQMKNVQFVSSDDEHAPVSPAAREVIKRHPGRILLLQFSGPFSFGAATDLTRRMRTATTPFDALVMDFGGVSYIDASIAMAIESLVIRARDEGKVLRLVGLSDPVRDFLDRMGVLDAVPADACAASLEHALQTVEEQLGGAAAP